MARYIVRRLLAIAAVTALAASCGSGPDSRAPFTPDIQTISDAIATAAKYPKSEVELTSSQVRLQISVSDAKLATADETTRNSEASAIVAATEQILASHPEYAKLQAISVAIIHPSARRRRPQGLAHGGRRRVSQGPQSALFHAHHLMLRISAEIPC